MNISKRAKLTGVQAPLATGAASTGLLSDSVDMSGFNGVEFTGYVGTVNSTSLVTLAIFSSTAVAGTYVAIGGATVSSTAGDTGDKVMAIDVYKPQDRFLKARLVRDGAGVEYGGTIAQQYEPGDMPTVHSTTTLYQAPVLSVSITT